MSRQSETTSVSVCFASASACVYGSFSCETITALYFWISVHCTLGPVMGHTASYTLDSVQLFLAQISDFSMHCA